MHRHTVQMSAIACAMATPVKPRIRGSIMIKGMKKMPFLAEEVIEACIPFPVACSIMLVKVVIASVGKTDACQRRARVPTAMTSGSLRNHATMEGAGIKHTTAAMVIMIVPNFKQNQKPSFTRSYLPAP